MRYVSEQFKAIQDEVLRPPMQIYFEVDTNIEHTVGASSVAENPTCFDTTVAPVVLPTSCTNGYYYAVVGDASPVDDPNRICAPDNTGDELSEPTHSVPFGITPIIIKGNEVLIGNDSEFWSNFVGFIGEVVLSFKGHIPEVVRVERYDLDNDAWIAETVINNPDLDEEVSYTPDPQYAGDFRRFYLLNTHRTGRYQVNWIRRDETKVAYGDHPGHAPVVFENSEVSSVSLDIETDLTSQSLPAYEMTVECLDVDEQYTPDTEYWQYQFKDDRPCYLKAGFEVNGITEYLPLYAGKLTQAPTYSEGKLTFKMAVNWKLFTWDYEMASQPNSALATGDIVDSVLFKDILDNVGGYPLFNSYDVFHGEDDIQGSECNHYGSIETGELRQLVANALGCYITAGVNTVDLHNTNDIQFKEPFDYLTRYEQVQATLESQPKVGKITITRNENLLSSDYVDLTAPAAVTVEADETVEITYKLPFYAFGKYTVTNYNKSVSSANVSVDSIFNGGTNTEGTFDVNVVFYSDRTTNIKPTIRFYGVVNNRYEETDTPDNTEGEEYTNSNELITNGYTANKARQVAHLINDSSNQYEVDMIQDFRYEIGDIVNFETKANTFEPCVITGLKYNLPGSNGHATLRKIFSLSGSSYIIYNAEGLTFTINDTVYGHTTEITILEVEDGYCAIGICDFLNYNTRDFVMLNVKRYTASYDGGEPVEHSYYAGVIDNVGKTWKFSLEVATSYSGYTPENPAFIKLPDYTTDMTSYVDTWAYVSLIKKLYEEQGLHAPIDYNCKIVYLPE